MFSPFTIWVPIHGIQNLLLGIFEICNQISFFTSLNTTSSGIQTTVSICNSDITYLLGDPLPSKTIHRVQV